MMVQQGQGKSIKMAIQITPQISIEETDLQISYIRAPGPGGQNVNKVSTGVQLRFNVLTTTALPEPVQLRLIALLGAKMTASGDVVIKATRYRTQLSNKRDALNRLQALILKAVPAPKKRKKTKPSKATQEKRLEKKKIRGKTKALRSNKPHL